MDYLKQEKDKNETQQKVIQEFAAKIDKYKLKIETLMDYRQKADLEVSTQLKLTQHEQARADKC